MNSLVQHHTYIKNCLHPGFDYIDATYQDNISMCSTNRTESEDLIEDMLEWLPQINLSYKAEKWKFAALEISFPGFVINSNTIYMEWYHISLIQNFHIPKSLCDVQVHWDVPNIYRKIICI